MLDAPISSHSFSSATPRGGVAPVASVYTDSAAADAHTRRTFSPPSGACGSESDGVTVITHGEVSPEVRDHRLWFHVFRNRFAKTGSEFSGTVGSLIPFLTAHSVGTKDGSAIVAGVKRGDCWHGDPPLPGSSPFFPRASRDRLKDSSLTRMTMMCLDLDKGDDGAEIVRRVKAAGFLAILAPSFSHLSVSETDLPHDKLEAHSGHPAPFSLEEACAFLVRVEGFNPSVLDAAEMVGVFEAKKGRLATRVRHSPLPKYRLVAPLASPWHVPPGLTETDAGEPWGNLMRGLAHSLGVVLDESTTDLQRLFYVPRRPEGREVTTHVIGGRLLDWRTIDPVENVTEVKPKAIARNGASGGVKRRAADRGVDAWVNAYGFHDPTIPARLRQRGRAFNLVRFMLSQGFEVRAGSPDRGGWVSFKCPNAEQHSEEDTPDHAAFYCAAPDDTYPTQGMCFHSHCRGLTVPAFVDLVLKDREDSNV